MNYFDYNSDRISPIATVYSKNDILTIEGLDTPHKDECLSRPAASELYGRIARLRRLRSIAEGLRHSTRKAA